MDVPMRGANESGSGPRKWTQISWRIVGLVAFIIVSAIAVGLGVGLGSKPSTSGGNTGGQTTIDSTAFSFASTMSSRQYKYLSYGDIVQRLRSLQATYPNLVEVYTTQDRYALPSAGYCVIDGYSQPCKVQPFFGANRQRA